MLWIISSGQLCPQNILNISQNQNRIKHSALILPENSSGWLYDMETASGEVLFPNMNKFKSKEKANA